jgi:hypothetical protein
MELASRRGVRKFEAKEGECNE